MYACTYVYAHVWSTLPICGLGVVLLLVFPFSVFSGRCRSHLVNIQLLVVVCVYACTILPWEWGEETMGVRCVVIDVGHLCIYVWVNG